MTKLRSICRTGGLRRADSMSSAVMPRRALILPVVLVMIGLLALTMAGFVFFVRAEVAGIKAENEGQQARLSAESAFEEILAVLRVARHDVTAWFDRPDKYRWTLVHSDAFKRQDDPMREVRSRKEFIASNPTRASAWRYALVGVRHDGPQGAIRFGVTPEAGKLNLNSASEKQIRDLLVPLLADLGVENREEIIDAILDWRDGDNTPRALGAENDWYNTLEPAYNAKNGPFDTVEELLLVKGVTAAILYGEDANRNGVLDKNEDDGDATFPYYDNADGVLNHGIAPFLTVFSRDVETALDNKVRINLNGAGAYITGEITKLFVNNELSDETIAFLSSLQQRGINPQMLRSPADLLAPGEDESALTLFANPAAEPVAEGVATQADGADGTQLEGSPALIAPSKSDGKEDAEEESDKTGEKSGPKKDARSRQTKEDSKNDPGVKPGASNPKGDKAGASDPKGGKGPGAGSGAGGSGAGTPGGGSTGNRGGSGAQIGGGRAASQPGRSGAGSGGGGGGAQQTPQQLQQRMFDALKASPITLAELPHIMDRFTTRSPQQAGQPIPGLIDINTAPSRVLALIPGITPEAIAGIIATRAQQPYDVLKTTAWPLTAGVVDAATLKRIAPYITTKSYQFHIEALGFADHSRTMRRFEWVVEMMGPMAQVKYFRDLTELGFAWPIDAETATVVTN